MTLAGLLEGASITSHHGDLALEITGVEHDSRHVEPGQVFFALDGAKARGLDFAPDAVRRGAVAVVATSAPEAGSLDEETTTVVVENVRRTLALAACAAEGHPTSQLPTVGITGTNGKTTITYMLESICLAADRPAGVMGTINVRFGDDTEVSGFTTPEAPLLQRMAGGLVKKGARILLMEVTSHALKMWRSHGIEYRVVAFTNLTQDHLDLHGDMDDYAATKLRLFTDELYRSPQAVAVVNIDDAFGRTVAAKARCPVVRASAAGDTEAEVRVTQRRLSLEGIEAAVEIEGEPLNVRCSQLGEHNLSNMVVALGIAHSLGLPKEAMVEGLARTTMVPGRLERVPDPRGTAVLVDYAHTPDALAAVTKALSQFTEGRLFVIFGCGGDRDWTKRPKMGEAAARGGDVVVVTSDNPRSEDPEAIIEMALPGVISTGLRQVSLDDLAEVQEGYAVEPDRRTAIGATVAAARPEDVVLIAGKGHEPYQILRTETIHFDDCEEAEAAILAAIDGSEEGRVESRALDVGRPSR